MAEDEKKSPAFEFKSLPLTVAETKSPTNGVKVKLDCAEPVKTGESQYGTWNMWFGFVENQPVNEGRKPNVKEIKDYTGKVLFFPSEKLNESLIAAANGNIGTEVLVHKVAEQGAKGLITKYTVEKLSDGTPKQAPNTSLTPAEAILITDGEALLRGGFKLTEEDFIKASQEPQYSGQISSLKAKELYAIIKR